MTSIGAPRKYLARLHLPSMLMQADDRPRRSDRSDLDRNSPSITIMEIARDIMRTQWGEGGSRLASGGVRPPRFTVISLRDVGCAYLLLEKSTSSVILKCVR